MNLSDVELRPEPNESSADGVTVTLKALLLWELPYVSFSKQTF